MGKYNVDRHIITRPGEPVGFVWGGTSDEARALWDQCEDMAEDFAKPASVMATSAITVAHQFGEPEGAQAQRELRDWTTYAALHFVAESLGLIDKLDRVFTVAETEEIRVRVSLPSPGHLLIEYSPLDS